MFLGVLKGVEMSGLFDIHSEKAARLNAAIETDGFAYMANAIPENLWAELRNECACARKTANSAQSDSPRAYRSSLSSLGQVGLDLVKFRAPDEILAPIFDQKFEYCEDASCYTFFETDDFLSPHLDGADNCEVTLLFYISATEPGLNPEESGLYLSIYDEGPGETPKLRKSIATPEGGIMVGRGSKVLHGRNKLSEGEKIWMLTACFRSV